MAFTLHIVFTGLCLFVRDSMNHEMYVLMPRTGLGTGGDHVHQHRAELIYDSKYDPNSQGVDGYHDLHRKELRFHVAGNTFEMAFKRGIVDLTTCARGRVPQAYLRGNPPPVVESRVVLFAGKNLCNTPGAQWDLNGCPVEMARDAIWTIEAHDANELCWELTPFRSRKPIYLPTLRPVPEDGEVIVVQVRHSVPGEPDIPCPLNDHDEYETPHFRAFHSLLRGSIGGSPQLIDCGPGMEQCPPEIGGILEIQQLLRPDRAPSVYTCMVAGGDGE